MFFRKNQDDESSYLQVQMSLRVDLVFPQENLKTLHSEKYKVDIKLMVLDIIDMTTE